MLKYFVEYCPDRMLRREVWVAKVLRNSLYGPSELQNSTPLETIRSNRHEIAQKLGYKSYAHMNMETKMAGSLENVYEFLDTLLETGKL